MIGFQDIKDQEIFRRDGYVVIDLLNAKEVEKLRELYFTNKEAHLGVDSRVRSTNDTENLELILMINEEISKIVNPCLGQVFNSFDQLIAGFLVKENKENSETGFHQDPTLVDRENTESANVWIALQDTNKHNGNLLLVKGSHRIVDSLVVVPDYPCYYQSFRSKIISYASSVPVRAGQAIILNNKLIHGAHINRSNEERIAVVMAIKSKEAKWVNHYLENGDISNAIEQYDIDTYSFANTIKNQRPFPKEHAREIHFDFPQVDFTEFKAFMQANYKTESVPNKVKRWISKMEF